MGNNYCKQLGIKPNRHVTGKDFDMIWKKYDTTHQGRLNKHQAQKFLKNFAQAVGEPYDKTIAAKLFDDCDEEKVGWITYSQFKKLFFNVATLKGSLSPQVPRLSVQSAGKPPEEPPIYLTNSLRVKLTRRPTFWQYVVNDDEQTDTPEEEPTVDEEDKWEEQENDEDINENSEENSCCHDDHIFHTEVNKVSLLTPKIYRKVKESPFVIITKDEIEKKIENTLIEVSKLLSISSADVGLLLPVFNWDKEKLYANYFDSPEKYMLEAGIHIGPVNSEPETDMFECPVCMDEVEYKDSFSLKCGHRYCNDCWAGQLKSAIDNYGANVLNMSKCLYPQCPSIVNRDVYQKLADSASYKKYVYFFNKNYIENNSDYTYCPSDCGNAVKCGDSLEPTDIVDCTCGKIFCFKCGNEYHNPVTCDQLKVWNEKNEEDKDGASLKLIQAISKPCPACGISTDRVDGCNHMTCQKCMHEWCWQCRAEWATHGKNTGGFYYCNRYDTSDAFKQDKEASTLRDEHNRFLHYYNGYYVNHKAEEGSKAMKEEVEKKGQEYYELTGGDQQFLIDAVESLIRCRHILKYTYIYGYFLPHVTTNDEDGTTPLIRTMFEVQQAFAQNICENLSKELLKPADQLERNKVVYNHKACIQYFNNLVNFFHNDEEKAKYSPRIDKKTMKRKSKKKTKDEQRDNNRWICSKCTFSNPTTESVCSLCSFDRANESI